jgi:hypothetical protein
MISIANTYARCGIVPYPAQLTFAKAACGELLTPEELAIWRECSGRADAPTSPPYEIDLIAGRKSGKTELILAPLVVHRAVTDTDAPGTYQIIAPSLSDQARIAWNAIIRMLERGFPNLIAAVKEGEGRVYLHSGNIIAIDNSNFRHLRGPKYKFGGVDEGCFFTSDDPALGFANPLEYVLDSIVGGMVSSAQPQLVLASTAWTKSGIMWTHLTERESRFVFQAPTLLMNPSANRDLMEKHRKDRGENFFRREYLAEFSEDSFAFIESSDVDLAICQSMPVFPAAKEHRYSMGLDPARARDHFGCAIAHKEQDVIVVDWCKEWKPGICGLRYADILPEIWQKAREYRIREIASDQVDFGGLQASIPLRNGVEEFHLTRIMTGGQAGAELSDTTRALFANHKLLLPNQPGLGDEFKRLADFLTQGGSRDVRAKRGHDDRSRACMLAIFQAFTAPPLLDLRGFNEFVPYNSLPPPDVPPLTEAERLLKEHLWEERCFGRQRGPGFR